MSENTILQFNSGTISAKLSDGKKMLVSNVSFDIKDGERLAIVGETGSGKTMIAHAIIGLLPNNVEMELGDVVMDGGKVNLGVNTVYIPQSGMESLNPSRKIYKQMYDSMRLTDARRKDYYQIASDKLRLVGIDDVDRVLHSFPFQLSGGMAKRVTLAIAACAEPKLVIADEPTGGIGYDAKLEFTKLLDEIFSKAAVMIITHDFEVAKQCDRVLVLCKGRVVEYGQREQILQSPRHPYTRALIGSLVQNGMQTSHVLRNAQGDCPFYDRCPNVSKLCETTKEHKSDAYREWWCNAND